MAQNILQIAYRLGLRVTVGVVKLHGRLLSIKGILYMHASSRRLGIDEVGTRQLDVGGEVVGPVEGVQEDDLDIRLIRLISLDIANLHFLTDGKAEGDLVRGLRVSVMGDEGIAIRVFRVRVKLLVDRHQALKDL